jgi:hypothetical protein
MHDSGFRRLHCAYWPATSNGDLAVLQFLRENGLL